MMMVGPFHVLIYLKKILTIYINYPVVNVDVNYLKKKKVLTIDINHIR